MFKLQIPITKKSWLDKYFKLKLKNLGNFYGGFFYLNRFKITGGFSGTNLRKYSASFSSLNEIMDTIKIINEKGFSFSYLFNQIPTVSKDKLIKEEIKFINEILKPKSIVMNDLIFMKYINKDIKIHISSLAGLFNYGAINYWKQNINNINRIIFSRDTSISNILNISKFIGNMDLEIFVKNCWCYHSNSHCGSLHKKGFKFLCHREEYSEKLYYNINKNKLRKLINTKLNCKVCSIYKFKTKFLYNKEKDIYLKIPGRERKIVELTKDIKFVDEVIENCKKSNSFKLFIASNICLHKRVFGYSCNYKRCEYFIENNNK